MSGVNGTGPVSAFGKAERGVPHIPLTAVRVEQLLLAFTPLLAEGDPLWRPATSSEIIRVTVLQSLI